MSRVLSTGLNRNANGERISNEDREKLITDNREKSYQAVSYKDRQKLKQAIETKGGAKVEADEYDVSAFAIGLSYTKTAWNGIAKALSSDKKEIEKIEKREALNKQSREAMQEKYGIDTLIVDGVDIALTVGSVAMTVGTMGMGASMAFAGMAARQAIKQGVKQAVKKSFSTRAKEALPHFMPKKQAITNVEKNIFKLEEKLTKNADKMMKMEKTGNAGKIEKLTKEKDKLTDLKNKAEELKNELVTGKDVNGNKLGFAKKVKNIVKNQPTSAQVGGGLAAVATMHSLGNSRLKEMEKKAEDISIFNASVLKTMNQQGENINEDDAMKEYRSQYKASFR